MDAVVKSVTHVEVVNGVRTERQLEGEELENWIKEHVKTEESNDNTGN